jgi:hypothetical protein
MRRAFFLEIFGSLRHINLMARKTRMIDPSKGYRIHLDTLHHSELLPSFAQAHAGTPGQHTPL